MMPPHSRRMLAVTMLAAAAVLVVGAASGAAATTWYVDDDGGAGIDYTKIQDAVNAAEEGDTIYVHGGTYVENVDIDTRINLIGIDMPVVDANGSGDAIRIAVDGCIVEGFEVTNSDWASGIKVESDGNVIKNNIVSGNCYAIHLLDSSNNEITENNVLNNDFGIHISTTEISTTIGAEGGIIEVTNPDSHLNGVKVEIPAGALDEATDIKLRPISQEELEKEMKVCYTGSAYDFLKAIHLDAGGVTFEKPINVTIPKPLDVSENGSILITQIFPDVDNNTKPDLILVDIGSVEGEFIVGSSSVEKGVAPASCLPVPGITQGGTLTFLYQGETVFLTGRVVDSMGSPLGGSIVTSLQSGGIKAISQANGECALNAALYGPGQQTIDFVACNHILNLLGTNNIPLNPLSVPSDKIVSVDDTEISKTKEEVEAEIGTRVLDGICEEPIGQALMAAFFESCMGVAMDATEKCVSNHLTESEYSFHPNEMDLHVGESGTFEVDYSSIVGSDVPIPSCPHVAIYPLICDVDIKLDMEIPVGTVTTLSIDASVEDENIATIVGTENPTLEDRALRVVVRGEDEGTTNLTGKITKCSASYSIKFSSGADETICENAKSAPNIDCGNTSITPATINVGCFPDDHFNDTEYEDSNHDWDGDGELDGTDKNGDTYGDKQITWHAERSHVVCEDFSVNSEDYTLTIEPGAEVTFVKGATLEAEEDGGVLIAEGTEDRKIVFREFGGGNCSAGLWTIIDIESDGSRFSYCSVEQGVAVYLDDVCLEVSHCTFSDTTVHVFGSSPTITENIICDDGSIDISGGDEGCSPSITKNTIAGSIIVRTDVDGSPNITGNDISDTQVGIFAWGGSPIITENTISDCNAVGISVSYDGSPTIIGNTILSSRQDGILVTGGFPGDIIGNNISGNGFGITFSDFSGTGYSSTISGNTISGSKKGYGIACGDSLTMSKNTISDNAGEGIAVCGSSIVSENTISDNGHDGIAVCGGSPTITGNTISDNGGEGIAVDGSPTITGNNITGNEDAGIDVKCGSPTITGNTILGNGWCGIYAPDASPSIAGNDIYGNGEDCSECGGEDQAPCECWECLHGATSKADAGYAKTANTDRKFISVVNDPPSNAEIGVGNILGTGVTRNSGCISSMSSSSNNVIYLNSFINNGHNAVSSESANIWNSTEKITYIHNGSTYLNYTGNYWDDYAGDDLNGDGIGNDPHPIPGSNSTDRFPLMQPWAAATSQKGDLNSDGIITPADAAIALRLAATGAHDDAADVSGDGRVTSLDALMILQAAAGGISL